MIGRIIRIISNQYLVADEEGRRVACVAMGKVRRQDKPRVGDWVEYTDFGDQTGIERIRPRMNSLIRPPVANVDQAPVSYTHLLLYRFSKVYFNKTPSKSLYSLF